MRYSFPTYINWIKRVKNYGIRNTISLMQNLKKDVCFAIRYSGNDFYLRGNTVDFAVMNSIFAKGEYNIEIDYTPEYIIDAGAFTGASALCFHNRYPTARIIAIEPEKSNFDLLVRNTTPYNRIQCIHGGLYNEDTRLVISDSAVDKYAFRVEKNEVSENSFPGYSIDTLMKKFRMPHIDILKMDIEGTEFNIFNEDDISWIKKVRVIIIELHEYLVPGVTDLFYRKISAIPYRKTLRGENTIISNLSEISR